MVIKMADKHVDIVIVGSGATGSLLAAKMSKAGKSVLILEGGPQRTTNDLWSSQIWSRRVHGTPFPTFNSGSDPVGWTKESGWGTGGAAIHHYANWFRFHPSDFRFKTKYGVGLDWPMTYDELRPYYDKIQEEVGISGDNEADIWSPPHAPYPQPPLPLLNHGKVIKRGFDKLGIPTAASPQAILSRPMGDRKACVLDGWCDAGCPTGALANPLVTYYKAALASGTQVLHDAVVSRVLTDQSGRRAIGVEYFDAAGKRQAVTADVVALAAFAIENPRILLNSASAQNPAGLANSSRLVGAYIMAHPCGSIYGLFDDETNPYMGRSGGELWSQANYENKSANEYVGGFQWSCGASVKPNDLFGVAMTRPDLFGKELDRFLIRASHHIGIATFLGHDIPVRENRVTLSDKRDKNGVRLAQVVHNLAPNSTAIRSAGIKLGRAIMQAAGATTIWTNPNINQHIMGGVIMGRDPAASVTDSYGIAHDVRNLVILGSSLYPTSAAVNPTFTLHALALRTAEYLVGHWGGLSRGANHASAAASG